ncbi:MAG: hypothetical protein EB140_12360, partial [Proteobacteria bacterium]|nr:hypothetical protein [Pseudomonadota bacterium]
MTITAYPPDGDLVTWLDGTAPWDSSSDWVTAALGVLFFWLATQVPGATQEGFLDHDFVRKRTVGPLLAAKDRYQALNLKFVEALASKMSQAAS